jgi:hypothetical protein
MVKGSYGHKFAPDTPSSKPLFQGIAGIEKTGDLLIIQTSLVCIENPNIDSKVTTWLLTWAKCLYVSST